MGPVLGKRVSSAQTPLTDESLVVVSPNQVSCDLSGEAAILQLKAGMYFGLDKVGARIWNLLGEPIRVGILRDVILNEYDVAPDECETDLLELLGELLKNGLIEVRIETGT